MSRAVAKILWTKAQGDFDAAVVLQLLAGKDCAVPEPFWDLDMLTPFTTQARYERVVPPGSFDRSAFLDLVRKFLAWTAGAR